MQFELNKSNIILIIIFVSSLIVFGMLYNWRNPIFRGRDDRIVLVTNYSRFFTISNTAERFINVLAREDTENLLLLLDEKYQETNNVSRNNIFNHFKQLEGDEYRFQARKMYEEKLSNRIIKYYIYGHLSEIKFNEFVQPTDYYLIIFLDTENSTYSVIPYDGDMFKEES